MLTHARRADPQRDSRLTRLEPAAGQRLGGRCACSAPSSSVATRVHPDLFPSCVRAHHAGLGRQGLAAPQHVTPARLPRVPQVRADRSCIKDVRVMQLLTVEALYEDDARRREAEEIRIVILEAPVSSGALPLSTARLLVFGARGCAVLCIAAVSFSPADRARIAVSGPLACAC